MDTITVDLGHRILTDVWVPTRFVERWRGMKRRRGAMLLPGSSVHGIGMDRSLTVVGLDSGLTVVAVRDLIPGAIALMPGAVRVLELESDIPPPEVGSRVRFYDRRHGGTSRGVRHADRQSGGHLGAARRDAPNR